jgi:hypothetical protein
MILFWGREMKAFLGSLNAAKYYPLAVRQSGPSDNMISVKTASEVFLLLLRELILFFVGELVDRF